MRGRREEEERRGEGTIIIQQFTYVHVSIHLLKDIKTKLF